MNVITYEPENNLVQIENDDGTETTLDYITFARSFTIEADGSVAPKRIGIPAPQRDAMALAAEIIKRSYVPVYPADPRPKEIREAVVDTENPAELVLVRAHCATLQMAAAATDLAKHIRTRQYVQASRAAWCFNEAISPAFDQERFARFYRAYTESAQ